MDTRPEVLAFLGDIKDNPEDNTPRLILADWLEERDDPRGTLIRVQCAIEETPRHDPRRQELRRLLDATLEKVQKAWPAPLTSIVSDYGYQRGLLWIGCEAERFLAGDVPRILASEEWAWVEGLMLWKVQPKHHHPLAFSALLEQILTLNLYGASLGEDGARELAASPHLRYLNTLRLGGNRIGPGGAHALAESRAFPRLRTIYLFGNDLGDAGVESLAGSETLAGLTRLNLAANVLTDRAAERLAQSPHLGRLTWLDVRDNRIGERGRALLYQRYGDGLLFGSQGGSPSRRS